MSKTPHKSSNIKPSVAEAIEQGQDRTIGLSQVIYVSGPEEMASDFSGAMDFGLAIRCMERGQRAQRTGWNGKGMWIAIQRPDANSKMGLPYLYMKTVTGELVPWLASQTDMLAKDWRLAG